MSKLQCLVTVVIPTLNEELYLGATLDALSSQSQLIGEVLVVDSSTDSLTSELAHKHSEETKYLRH